MLITNRSFIKLSFRILILLYFISNIFPQNDKIMIMDIVVEGNNRLSDQDIQRNARIYKGMAIKGPEIQQAINRLWNLKRFNNIQIVIDNETNEGIYLRIIVEENPSLGEINFTGNKKKSSKSLNEEIQLESGQILTPNSIFEAMEKIRALYSEKHYHSIKIDTVCSFSEKEQTKNLTFVINEGNKNKIKKIAFSGNTIFSDKKLSRIFKENKAKKWYAPWRGAWKKDLLQSDKDLLYNFYKNKGYRDFYIIEENIETSIDQGNIDISFQIYEGPKYKIRNITWDGNYIHSDKELSSRLGFYKGAVFTEDKFQLALSEKVNPLYSDAGYFYFQAIPSYTPVSQDSLDIHFSITENQIVHVRKINIKGNKRTFDNVIRRELRVYPGDLFSRKKLMDSYRDIFMLNFFENVIPNVVPVNDEEIDIELEVFEKSTGQANFSMGYNGIHGFTGGGGFEFPNFRGRGQSLGISYNRGLNSSSNNNSMSSYNPTNYNYTNNQDAAAYQSFSVNFMEPRFLDTPNLIGSRYSYTEKGPGQANQTPFDVKEHGMALTWGRRFKWPDYFFKGSWRFQGNYTTYSSNNLANFYIYYGINNIDINQVGNLFVLSNSGVSFTQTITRDSRNHPEFPTNGSKSIWTSTLSGAFLGGDYDYHKHKLDFNWFTPIYNKVAISQIFKLGALKKIEENSIIPPRGVRFIMGGTGIGYSTGEMLRGYKDGRIGPTTITGGNIMLKYSLELRFLLSENPTIYTLSFFEMGNVWSGVDVLDPFQLKRSAGVGIRVFIPMLGMLGYDIGYGFDPTNNDEIKQHGWEYHLIFGMPF